jgi:hypothetical protein
MTTTIGEQVRHLAKTTAAKPPKEVMDAFAREQADLAAQGTPAGVIQVGRPCLTPTCSTLTARR